LAGISDPFAALTYLTRGKVGTKYLFYHRLANLSRGTAARYENEIDSCFVAQVAQKLASVDRSLGTIGFPEVVYSIVRHTKPRVVVETGVAAGLSSAYILKGLEDNHLGHLYSIDLPNHEETLAKQGKIRQAVAVLPKETKPGFAIPDDIRGRWTFLQGNTRDILPSLLAKLHSVDIFLHDSEHTYENMMFEYSTSWPHIESKGFLLSDNINDNRAFFDFAKKIQRRISRLFLSPLGGIRKQDTF
jgi:hypothetical protein